MKNKHIRYDLLTARASKLAFGKRGFFTDSVDSETFRTHISSASCVTPAITGEGRQKFGCSTLAGDLDMAFEVAAWKGTNRTTLIYHHGNNERPFNRSSWSKNTFRDIFLKRPPADMNLIVVQAPFHDIPLRDYLKHISGLNGFMSMVTASVCATSSLVEKLKEEGAGPIIVSGISLGGWVTNLHHAAYGDADRYIPMLAGADLGHVFTESAYAALAPIADDSRAEVRRLLDFRDMYSRADHSISAPLLGIHDQFIVYGAQSPAYEGGSLTSIDKGHVTATMASDDLRRHVDASVMDLMKEYF